MIRLRAIINKDTIKETMDALPSIPQPFAPVVQAVAAAHHGFRAEFIDYIKSVENPTKVGYRRGKWYVHRQPEGSISIGYGHVLKPAEHRRARVGMSNAEIEKLLMNDLTTARNNVYEYLKKTYRINLVLPKKTEEMFIDLAYNLGNLGEFPRFVDAIVRGKMDLARLEYKRHYHTPSGKKRMLTKRNQMFYKRYLT